MGKEYEEPEFEVILLDVSDVITNSSGRDDWETERDNPWKNSPW